jgi:hypothetical protein
MGASVEKFILTATLVATSYCALAQSEQDDPLFTRKGWQIGAQVANYHYEEPGVMLLEGERGGATVTYTHVNTDRFFTRLEGRVSYGLLRYDGSGVLNNSPDLIMETRVLLGQDVSLRDNLAFSPYVGLGYRYLYSDIRGYSSTGLPGYRRHSQYWYVPMGATLRMTLGERSVLAPTVELDAFLAGTQYTQHGDTGLPGFIDFSNRQNFGYGYRVYLMVETGDWSLGPWLHYWSIGDSDAVYASIGRFWYEPTNWTREYGLELRLRF